ncbi:hypothetical protein CR513_32575, partial [Mucuna pruriens]
MRLKSKVMESKVEALEQQNQDLRAVTTLVNTNTAGYAQNGYARKVRDPPYGMPQGWNIENAANEEQEQQNAVNNAPVFNANSRAGPNPKEDLWAQTRPQGIPLPLWFIDKVPN